MRWSSPGCCGTRDTTPAGSRSGSRRATSSSRGRPELPSYLRRLGDADELAVLLRLFLLGVPVHGARLEDLVGDELGERLAAAGLLVRDQEVVHGAARIVPHDELLIASDHARAAEAHADHVPGVHRPSVASPT